MFDKFTTAIEPFAITLIMVAGASLAGWLQFSNKYTVGVVVVLIGIMLMLKHIVQRVRAD
jgi:hypothetical protein